MKIVHELYNRCQVGGGALRPYAGKEGLPRSGYVDELLIVSSTNDHREDDCLYIEGDLRVLHQMFRDALAVLECVAADAVKEGTLDPEWDKEEDH